MRLLAVIARPFVRTFYWSPHFLEWANLKATVRLLSIAEGYVLEHLLQELSISYQKEMQFTQEI